MDLAKLITVLYIMVELVAAVPLGYSNHEAQHTKTGFAGFINPLFAPITKAQQYFNNFGGLFSPAVATPNTYENMHVRNNYEEMHIHNNPIKTVNNEHNKKPVTETVSNTFSRNDYNDKNISNKTEKPPQIDQETLNKIFNNFKEIDQNSITTTEDFSEYTTGTGDYETTTDYLLRIPAPVVATLLGK